MKAKHLKQHQIKIEPEISEDDWGNEVFIVGTRRYTDEKEAIAAARKIMEDEFRKRYVK